MLNKENQDHFWVYKRTFSLVHTHVTICSNNQEIDHAIRFVIPDAKQDFSIQTEISYRIHYDQGYYRIITPAVGECFHESDQWGLGYYLLQNMHEQAFKTINNYIHIHAALGHKGSTNFLIVGEKGAGKTTLVTRLLSHGFEIDGDELALIRDTSGFAFPRRFHIKEASVGLLPEIKAIQHKIPFIQSGDCPKLFAFSPAEWGGTWRVQNRPIDVIFYIESNHQDQKDYVAPRAGCKMVQKLMSLTYMADNQHSKRVKGLCKLVQSASCFTLHYNNLNEAVRLLQNTLTHCP